MADVCVRELAKELNWKQVAGNEESLDRPILIADINRPGLELTGYFDHTEKKRIVVLGEKEIHYINEKMDEIAQRRNFEEIVNDVTPCILVTRGNKCPEILKEIADRKDFPVFETDELTTDQSIEIFNILEEKLAPFEVMHGELLQVHGIGVMIIGESGMGKSEIALELVKNGHQIIADDRIDCYKIHNRIIGKTPPLLEGFMEMRGVGIINVARMYGVGSYAKECEISLQIELVHFDGSKDYDRVGIEEKEYVDIMGVKMLKLTIPVTVGRSMATIIESAVYHCMLIREGKDAAREIESKVLAEIRKNEEEEHEAISK